VTSSFYMVSNLWKGFVTASISMFIHHLFFKYNFIVLFG
jgi:hypothetical protein